MNLVIEQFFNNAKQWKEEFYLLRKIITENKDLLETFKWMHPCYTIEGKNIVLIHGFKEYCAILFHKGALIKDNSGLLIQQTKNVQSARQMRFTNTEEIIKQESLIKEYISQAIDIEKSGQKVAMKQVSDYTIPETFLQLLNQDEAFKKAFYALTPGRQKGYLFYFNQAKQAKTQKTRIEKYYSHILDGKGIND
ncbi:YdeI/OmpD-associated family protein [Polluticaenibacter yanchengensis]|uniref:DUF1801 domain-containing protein n=1 Tax=Polluticaenibacter yanchengensis TaxID=3014562 RepID=A0ABT4UP76_9BACT|nr:DUF1801 domain-containing protein [Chitinophagaceae bacterium LY-5]